MNLETLPNLSTWPLMKVEKRMLPCSRLNIPSSMSNTQWPKVWPTEVYLLNAFI